MGKLWVLDTETKGTGAEMVPLEKLLRERAREPRPLPLLRRRRRRSAREPEPSRPLAFKVVDVMTGRTLAEGVDVQSVLGLLEETATVVDVSISVWQPEPGRWRRLTHRERELLWDAAHRRDRAAPAGG
jgi:hypothetical protein